MRVIQGVFDASGVATSPVLVVAGFAANDEVWKDFSRVWTKRLKRDGLTYFHAKDAAGFWGEFRPWKALPEAERTQRRKALYADLMQIIRDRVFHSFGVGIRNTAFAQMNPGMRAEFHLTALSVAGRTCEKHMREWLARDYRHSRATSEVIFEDGDKGKGTLIQRFKEDCCLPLRFEPKKRRVLDSGKVQRAFIPLQAADWYAHEFSRAYQSLNDPANTVECISDLRWPMQQFTYIPGRSGVFDLDDISKFESGIEQLKELRKWWNYLESLKSNGPPHKAA